MYKCVSISLYCLDCYITDNQNDFFFPFSFHEQWFLFVIMGCTVLVVLEKDYESLTGSMNKFGV